jgi:hypothetical protein
MPAERLALLRIFVGAFAVFYLAIRGMSLASVARFAPTSFSPVGPVAVLDAPLVPAIVYLLAALALVLAVLFTLGWRYRLVGPLFALLFLWVTSYRSSFGMKFHTENLLALHVLLLSVAPAADVLCLGAPKAEAARVQHGRYGWAIRAMCVVTVVTYVLAGIAKLRNGGWDWMTGDVLRLQVAYDNLRKIELGSLHSPLGALLVGQAWFFPPLAVMTMLVELGAPLALFHRRLAKYWVVAAWLFHMGVLALMAIAFPYPMSAVAYLAFFEIERVLDSPKLRRLLERLPVARGT